MIRPTRRTVLIFAGGVPVVLFMVIAETALWRFSFYYGVIVLMALVTDVVLALPFRQLKLAIATPPKLYIGDQGAVSVTIGLSGYLRSTAIDLLAEHTGPLDPPVLTSVTLAPGTEALVALPLVPRRRGHLSVDALWLRWTGPLGLAQTTRRVPLDRAIDVVPNVRGVQSAALQYYSHEAVFGVKVQHQRGEGAEFDALREYAPGLDHRHIDWKHSARHRKLLCKEFKTERNHQVILAFDTGYLMGEPIDGIPRLDHAINAGLLLTWISLQGGDLVGTYGFDAAARQYQTPIRGIGSFSRIQQATADLAYHPEETNFTLGLAELTVRLKRRALVVLFTDFVDTVTAELLVESVQRIALRHVLVFVTLRDTVLEATVDAPPEGFDAVARSVVAHDLLRDRRVVLERLERVGIHCLDVPSRGLSVELLNRYLMIKQRGLI